MHTFFIFKLGACEMEWKTQEWRHKGIQGSGWDSGCGRENESVVVLMGRNKEEQWKREWRVERKTKRNNKPSKRGWNDKTPLYSLYYKHKNWIYLPLPRVLCQVY